jgi:endonuclease/exonuclease/phosphatase family metal-dependent hydrolase
MPAAPRLTAGRAVRLTGGMRKAICLAVVLAVLPAACGSDDDGRNTADPPDVTVASLNVLHGIFCPAETEDCRAADRMDLLFDWVESIGCPDVLLLQEVLGTRMVDLIGERAVTRCPFAYEVLVPPLRGQNVTLSRYPIVQTHEDRLVGNIRIVWHTRVDHPTGVVDVFNTHLAAGIDSGPAPCSEPCPAECTSAGAVTNRECQAVQVANFAELRSGADSLRVLAGDFNANPTSFVYRYLVEQRGWVDSYLLAGNPECDASTGIGCTSGREDEALEDMESPANGVRSRIDFLFVQGPTGPNASCDYVVDSHEDDDGDGFATMIFTDDPNPFAETCGPSPDPICWPSDHEGMQADINCVE